MMTTHPVIIRPAFPDELARARTLLNGQPVPPQASFLVAVKEHPVERLVAAIPWWRVPQGDSENREALRFHLSHSTQIAEETLYETLHHLEELARENQLSAILTDFSLPQEHPLFVHLTARGYEITQTDRYFSVPGKIVKARSIRIHERIKSKLPPTWQVESIRGLDPEKFYALVATHGLMPPQHFQNYWNTANPEHFEQDYSYVLIEKGVHIGIFLVTRRGASELHIHVEAVSPEYLAQSALISACLRNASFSRCPEGFPTIFTLRADSQKHRQTANSALRQGGSEQEPRHFLKKSIPTP